MSPRSQTGLSGAIAEQTKLRRDRLRCQAGPALPAKPGARDRAASPNGRSCSGVDAAALDSAMSTCAVAAPAVRARKGGANQAHDRQPRSSGSSSVDHGSPDSGPWRRLRFGIRRPAASRSAAACVRFGTVARVLDESAPAQRRIGRSRDRDARAANPVRHDLERESAMSIAPV